MSQQWFIVRSDDEDGPHTSSQLKSLADSGFLTPQMEVREANRTKSIPAGKLRGLFADEVTADVSPKMPLASSHPLQIRIAPLSTDAATPFRESPLQDTGASVSPTELPAPQSEVLNPQSGRIIADRIRINEIRQSLTQKLLSGGPDLPECPSVKATCDELNRLRTDVANFDNRLDRLEAARVCIERLERDCDLAKATFETTRRKLLEFHKLLGTVAYDEFLLGNIAEHSAFEARSQLEQRITALVKDRDVLASQPNAGLIQNATKKTRQWAISAQLMLEKSRIGEAERQVGKRLIDSKLEDSVRCERSERLIGEIQQLRKEIQLAGAKHDESKQNLIQHRLTTAEELDLKKFHNGTQFNDQVREIRNQRTQAQRFFDQYTNDIPDRLKADDQLPAGALANEVSELQRLELIAGPTQKLTTLSNMLTKVTSITRVPKSLGIAGVALIACLLLYAGLSFVGAVFRGQTIVNTDVVKNDEKEFEKTEVEMENVAVEVADRQPPRKLKSVTPKATLLPKPKTDVVPETKTPILSQPDLITNSVGGKLKLIPAGEFLMGSPVSEADRSDYEGPQHSVRITKPYYLGVTEVTQFQWFAVMQTKPWAGQQYVKEGDDYPAVYVSWEDAVKYCEKLSATEGKVYRLPREGEWEYACRGGSTTAYSFGGNPNQLSDHGWWGGLAGGNVRNEQHAQEVGTKASNPYGLSDMHGNVSEWCLDRDGEYTGNAAADPVGHSTGSRRVLRGGSWKSSAENCRSADRSITDPSYSNNDLGFRLALSPSSNVDFDQFVANDKFASWISDGCTLAKLKEEYPDLKERPDLEKVPFAGITAYSPESSSLWFHFYFYGSELYQITYSLLRTDESAKETIANFDRQLGEPAVKDKSLHDEFKDKHLLTTFRLWIIPSKHIHLTVVRYDRPEGGDPVWLHMIYQSTRAMERRSENATK